MVWLRLLIVVVALAAGGFYGMQWHETRRRSPFALWDFRAGLGFDSLDAQAARESKRQYTCTSLADAAGRYCLLETSGIRGLVSLLLDTTTNRAIVIRFQSSDSSRTMREEMRKAAASWNLVSAGQALDYTAGNDQPFAATHWRSRDRRWSATIQFGDEDRFDIVTLRDDRALAQMHARSPMSIGAHQLHHLINPLTVPERDAATARARDTASARVASNEREGQRLATAASRLPQCRSAQPDLVGGAMEREYDGGLSEAEMSRAVQFAHPGTKLVIDRGSYFVDSTGWAEYVQLSRTAIDHATGVAVFGLTYVRRAEVVAAELDAAAAPSCRSLAEVIVARLDERGEVVQARVIPVAADATLSRLVDVDLARDDADLSRTTVSVRSEAVYAAPDWTGVVDWEELANADSGSMRGRMPRGVSKEKHGNDAMGGVTTVDGVTLELVRFLVYGTDEMVTSLGRPVVVRRRDGYLNGWTLLHAL